MRAGTGSRKQTARTKRHALRWTAPLLGVYALGAPYWDQYARGALLGITRGTTDGHIARATLEGIAFQVYDIVKAMGVHVRGKRPLHRQPQ